MKKIHCILAILTLILSIFITACGGNSNIPTANIPTDVPTDIPTVTAIPALTNTPDPCASENLEAEVQKVHKYMREFDDASALAASRPRDQLADSIAGLQKIRRDAEDQLTPTCLINLKTYQISHMNSVINTLIAFMSGSDQQVVDQGIAQARGLHDQYTIELARVLGLTMVPAATPAITLTPSP